MSATGPNSQRPVAVLLAIFCATHLYASAMTMFLLLEWAWSGPRREAALMAAALWLVSASAAGASLAFQDPLRKRLLLGLSMLATGMFSGGAVAAALLTPAAPSVLLGAVIGVILWSGIGLFAIRARPSNRARAFSRGIVGTATLSGYALAFWSGAHALSALHAGLYGWSATLFAAALAAFGLTAFLARALFWSRAR